MILRLWGKKKAPIILQALHFSIALGAFISPLVVAPFLAPIPMNIPECTSMTQVTVSSTSGSKTIPTVTSSTINYHAEPEGEPFTEKPSQSRWEEILESERGIMLEVSFEDARDGSHPERGKRHVEAFNMSHEESHLQTASISANISNSMNSEDLRLGYPIVPDPSDENELQCQDDRFEIGYIIIGTLVLFSSLIFFFLLFTVDRDESQSHVNGEDKPESKKDDETKFRTRILSLLFIFFILYVGGEVAYITEGTWQRSL